MAINATYGLYLEVGKLVGVNFTWAAASTFPLAAMAGLCQELLSRGLTC